ncbi:MAG: hypothetical protein H8D34_33035 [Chloroflexi bacterium]|nr:hypothetical protein [Chloroflexota bacterium]MBL7162174.1 hypothetical protein [Anaerolineales bacterium]
MDTYRFPLSIFRFSKNGLWTIFLMAAFPTHVWTILLILQDFAWVAERNNNWDAIGVGAYGLLAAFVESVFVFIITILLGSLLPRQWRENKRLTVLSILIFVVGIWAILNQLYFLIGLNIPRFIFQFLINSAHPLQIIYILCLVLVIPSVLLPVYFVSRSEKALQVFQDIIERLSLLTMLYLIADFGGLVIVLIRNI